MRRPKRTVGATARTMLGPDRWWTGGGRTAPRERPPAPERVRGVAASARASPPGSPPAPAPASDRTSRTPPGAVTSRLPPKFAPATASVRHSATRAPVRRSTVRMPSRTWPGVRSCSRSTTWATPISVPSGPSRRMSSRRRASHVRPPNAAASTSPAPVSRQRGAGVYERSGSEPMVRHCPTSRPSLPQGVRTCADPRPGACARSPVGACADRNSISKASMRTRTLVGTCDGRKG